MQCGDVADVRYPCCFNAVWGGGRFLRCPHCVTVVVTVTYALVFQGHNTVDVFSQ